MALSSSSFFALSSVVSPIRIFWILSSPLFGQIYFYIFISDITLIIIIIIIIIYSLRVFSLQRELMVFHWGLSDSKSPQVYRTLLNILADLNNAVVWMVSTLPLISKSSNPCINPFVTVARPSITIGIIVTFIFHSFFLKFPCKVLILLFAYFLFYSVVSRIS